MAHIIHKITPTWQSDDWRNQFARAFRKPEALLDYLRINTDSLADVYDPQRDFPLRVPQSFAARMRKGDPDDPLLLQVLPVLQELEKHADFNFDPVGDLAAEKTPGLLHKYHGRVLIVLTGACAVHCRYCFRRHFPYHNSPVSSENFERMIAYINTNKSIDEVILSGGDPLSLDDDKLARFITRLQAIPHVNIIRLHTRLPVVLPARVTEKLVAMLQKPASQFVMVLHINHANEINDEVIQAVDRIGAAGAMLLNQAVLLRGINDTAQAQIDLSKKLLAMRVKPYYLHMLDKVAGAAHFQVPLTQAREIITSIQAQLPGYLVPRLVVERAGEKSKTPLL